MRPSKRMMVLANGLWCLSHLVVLRLKMMSNVLCIALWLRISSAHLSQSIMLLLWSIPLKRKLQSIVVTSWLYSCFCLFCFLNAVSYLLMSQIVPTAILLLVTFWVVIIVANQIVDLILNRKAFIWKLYSPSLFFCVFKKSIQVDLATKKIRIK